MTEERVTEPIKLWNNNFIFMVLISMLTSFSFYMVATVLSKYLVEIGIDISVSGVIVGLLSVTSLICRPFCGALADRINNVRLLKLSCILMSMGLVGYVLTIWLPLIVFARIIHGIGFAIGGTAQVALVSKHIPKDRTGEGIGYMGLGTVVGSAVAPGLGLIIAQQAGIRGAFIIASLLPLAAFGILFTFHSERNNKEKLGQRRPISWKDMIAVKVLPYTLVSGSWSFINGIIASYLVLFADELKVGGVSIYFTLCAVVLFLVRPISGKLMDKKGIRFIVFPALLLTSTSMFLLGRSTSLIMILISGIIRSIGQGAGQPSLQAESINVVGRKRSGVAASTFYLGGDIGQGIGPMVGGLVLGQIAGVEGYRVLFDGCGLMMLLMLIFFLYYQRKANR